MSDLQEKVRLFEKTGYGGKESVKLNQIYCESFSPGIRYKRVGKAAIAWKKNLRQVLLTALRLTQNVLNVRSEAENFDVRFSLNVYYFLDKPFESIKKG